MSKSLTLVARFNDRSRVAEDPLQWILQVRKGRNTDRSTGGWQSRYFTDLRTGRSDEQYLSLPYPFRRAYGDIPCVSELGETATDKKNCWAFCWHFRKS